MLKKRERRYTVYTIQSYSSLDDLLGHNWHYRGINGEGDFSFVILSTVEFYLHERRRIKEYLPSTNGVRENFRSSGYKLTFNFVRGDDTFHNFGRRSDIFT